MGPAASRQPSGANGRMAMPLSEVARLEEFPRSTVERTGQRMVVQYRGEIMPLVDLGRLFASGGGAEPDQALQVVVYTAHGRSVGLVVDRIIDIVDENIHTEPRSARQGIVASAVIQGCVTELLDVAGAIRMADPNLFTQMAS